MNKSTMSRCTTLGYFLSASLITMSISFSPSTMAGSITQALDAGKAKLDVRMRAETVDQDGIDKSATAVTVRTRLGYESGRFLGAKVYAEFENTTALVDDYGPLTPNFPVVADPEGSEVNQLFLTYSGVNKLRVKAGRQRVILDNARFVGNVGWRQNEQTYDGLLLQTTAIPKLTATYAYVTQVNGITGGANETDTQLINLGYSGLPARISAYSYMIDNAGANDSMTIGARASGKVSFGGAIKALYSVELAQLGDFADNSSGDSANYYTVELGAAVKKATFKFGYEVLGGDGTTSFQTPLATKHKFNGWADKFLNTPVDGLVDTYFTATSKISGVKLVATYHIFSSDNADKDFGSELNLLAAKKFGKHYSLGLKYAGYSAGDDSASINNTDTSKVWLWGGLKF